MKEQVTIIPIPVVTPGQQYSFQQRLPRTTARIIGIETGINILSLLPPVATTGTEFKRTLFLGNLQLQLNGSPNLFWSDTVIADDNSIAMGELRPPNNLPRPAIGIVPAGGTGRSFYQFHDCTHGTKKEEQVIDICGSRLISGQYRDYTGQFFTTGIRYTITLYVWTENSLT